MTVHDFVVKDKSGNEVSLKQYEGKVLLIVNTASKCGLTPQYKGLQELYTKYGNEQFEILAFPCNQFANQEPGDAKAITEFCTINYGVTFPVFGKIDVNGDGADPLFDYLKSKAKGLLGNGIKWNFTKFLIDSKGNVVERYAPKTEPAKLETRIKALIANS